MFCACTVPTLLNLTTLAADPNALENTIFVSLRFESKSISVYVIYEVEMEAAPVGDGWVTCEEINTWWPPVGHWPAAAFSPFSPEACRLGHRMILTQLREGRNSGGNKAQFSGGFWKRTNSSPFYNGADRTEDIRMEEEDRLGAQPTIKKTENVCNWASGIRAREIPTIPSELAYFPQKKIWASLYIDTA